MITDHGAVRNQFHHVIDIAPTILEAASIEAPREVSGIPQKPIEGDATLAELAQRFDVHPNQITEWRRQLVAHVSPLLPAFSARSPNTTK